MANTTHILPIQAMRCMSASTLWMMEIRIIYTAVMEQGPGRYVTQEKSWCRTLKSHALHISGFTPLFSAPEQGTVIGIAGRTDSSCASRRENGMYRGRGKRGRWRETVGERQTDKACIISPSLSLEATWLYISDRFGNVKLTMWKQQGRDQPFPVPGKWVKYSRTFFQGGLTNGEK